MRILYAAIFSLLITACIPKQVDCDYDFVIVGAGLAGLAAGAEIDSDNLLILEKNEIVGGRVLTHNYQNKYYYDMGAVFALDTNYRDKIIIEDHEFEENEAIGFYLDDKLYTGNDIYDCLRKIPNIDSDEVMQFINGEITSSSNISPLLYSILNTNIKAVFPAALENYNSNIQQWALVRHNSAHFKKGNQNVSEYLLQNIEGSVQLNSEVISISDNSKYVSITYNSKGKIDTITSKKVIVATPANIANSIISNKNESTQEFLDGVEYAGYYTVAIGVNSIIDNPKLAYVMPVNFGLSSILHQKTEEDDFSIFMMYIAEEDFNLFNDTIQIYDKAVSLLNEIWQIETQNIAFKDIYFWKHAGVIINDHYLKEWNDEILFPSNNVVLAGDYCNFSFGMPYGMIPAIESGKKAARLLLP